MADPSTGRCAGRYVDPLRHDADDVGWMVNRTPLLSRRTGAGHEVDCDIRLVPGFRFVEKLHACRLPWIRQLKVRDENDETFMIADFPGHRSCLIAFHPYRPGQVVTYNGGGSVATGSNAPPSCTVTVRADPRPRMGLDVGRSGRDDYQCRRPDCRVVIGASTLKHTPPSTDKTKPPNLPHSRYGSGAFRRLWARRGSFRGVAWCAAGRRSMC